MKISKVVALQLLAAPLHLVEDQLLHLGRVPHPHRAEHGGEGVHRDGTVDHLEGGDVPQLKVLDVGDDVQPGDAIAAGQLDVLFWLLEFLNENMKFLFMRLEGGTEELQLGSQAQVLAVAVP